MERGAEMLSKHDVIGQERPMFQPEKCPRCDSINTKFCYFNNYSTSQPRFFCKTCKRHWTKGGVLRNIPVGGKPRKPRRSRRSSAAVASSAAAVAIAANMQPAAMMPPPLTYPPILQESFSSDTIDIASLFASQPSPIPPLAPLNNRTLPFGSFGGYFGNTPGLQGMGNVNMGGYPRLAPMNGLPPQQQQLPLQQQRAAASGLSAAWSSMMNWHGQNERGGPSNM